MTGTKEKSTGVYVMRVAAMLSGMHPQTLRKYERAGLLTPSRSNKVRLYSDEDIARLKMIKYLVDDLGLNLSGVELALKVQDCLLEMRSRTALVGIGGEVDKRLIGLLDGMLQCLGTEMVTQAGDEAGSDG